MTDRADISRRIKDFFRGLTPFELWEVRYRIWIEDDPWCWEYRLIHGEE